jgi:hypothetical protein
MTLQELMKIMKPGLTIVAMGSKHTVMSVGKSGSFLLHKTTTECNPFWYSAEGLLYGINKGEVTIDTAIISKDDLDKLINE